MSVMKPCTLWCKPPPPHTHTHAAASACMQTYADTTRSAMCAKSTATVVLCVTHIHVTQLVFTCCVHTGKPDPCTNACAFRLSQMCRCEEANDGDERSDAMLLPAFLEAMAQVALNAAAASTHRLQAAASPDELKALKRYVDVCPAPWNVELQV